MGSPDKSANPPMKLYYDKNDLPVAEKLRDQRFTWLCDLGATELAEAEFDDSGFLFSYQHGEAHLLKQGAAFPGVHDRPDERQELVNLDDVLGLLNRHSIKLPTPKTWILGIDDELPSDLAFPLFVRTRKSSWKRGGQQAKVQNERELNDEAELLRRAFGWETPIIAREWLNLAVAGQWMFGDAPQEVRTWMIDGEPVAWSFHYLHAIPKPTGFPPSPDDVRLLKKMATLVAKPFRSRLIAADFFRDVNDKWFFMEAGPGAVSGTAHEHVFKYVANRLVGNDTELEGDNVGGLL